MPTHATYRKERSSALWHFCMNCKDWPAKDFDEISSAANPPVDRALRGMRGVGKKQNAKVLTKSCLARKLFLFLSHYPQDFIEQRP
jgi:hypothetical protein